MTVKLARGIHRVALAGFVATAAACGDRDPVRASPAVASVAFVTHHDTVLAGSTSTFPVRVRETAGGVLHHARVIWGSSEARVATVDAAGRVTAAYPGQARIVASVLHFADTLALTVLPAPVSELLVSGVPAQLAEGDTARLAVTLRAASGAVINDPRVVAYASSTPSVAVIDDSGVIRAVAPGLTTITAGSEGRSAGLQLEVTRASVAQLDVRAGAALLVPGGALQLSVGVLDQGGHALVGRAVTYRSSDPRVLTVTEEGLVGAHEVGDARIVVASEGVSVERAIKVMSPPPSAFTLDLRIIGDADAEAVDAIRTAVARWSRVIIGDLPDVKLTLPAHGCFDDTPAVDEVVDDVLLFVHVATVDGAGGILGHAGPCVVRQQGLPAAGIVVIDRADLAWVIDQNLAVDLFTHEIGHVLGIGSLWTDSPAVTGLHGADPSFIGAASREAQAAIGFSVDAAVPVPIENDGGPGTRDAHWRDRVFGVELMTGWLNARHNPLSLITVGALADLGYGVTPTGAEPFAYAAGGQVGSGQLSRSGTTVQERHVAPRWRLGADGRLTRIE